MELDRQRSTIGIVRSNSQIATQIAIYACIAWPTTTTISAASNGGPFTSVDNYLIDCGANSTPTLPDGRVFKTNEQASKFLNAQGTVQLSGSTRLDSGLIEANVVTKYRR
ncbi:hypothetical protein CCACVL1_25609, partial [Corchorus capsularis]